LEDVVAKGGPQTGAAIRAHRERLGLTQHELAERIQQVAWAKESRRVGVNAQMVSKWERGAKAPSRGYARIIADVLAVPVASLGETPGSEGRVSPGEVQVVPPFTPPEIIGCDDDALTLLLPKLLEHWRDEMLNRRDVLRVAGVLPAAIGVDALGLAPGVHTFGRPRFRGDETLMALEALMARVEAAYHGHAPRPLLQTVRALSETSEELLAAVADHRSRRRILNVMARANLLAGRLRFFDMRQAFEARSHFDLAREAAEATGDGTLQAVVLGHMAFLPAEKLNLAGAQAYVARARETLQRDPNRSVASWLSAVESEFGAKSGDTRAALAAVERARRDLEDAADGPLPSWFDFFDQNRLSGFEGYALRRAGRHEQALAALQPATTGKGLGPKQQAVAVLDLATVHLCRHDLDEACKLATAGALELGRSGYMAAAPRLVEFRASVPDTMHPAVRLLDETLAELA